MEYVYMRANDKRLERNTALYPIRHETLLFRSIK